ncbi:MAG: cupin domain-containing protein, partial [Gaiella sp.]
APGGFHDFHKHPDQDELIVVKAGRVVQWLERERKELGVGDSVYIDKDVVHGSFNEFEETAELQVILAPASGDGGYELVDVAGDEPWATLRG